MALDAIDEKRRDAECGCELAAPHAVAPKNSFVDVDLRQYTGGFTNVSPVYAAFAPTNGTVALLADGHTAEFTAAGNFSGLGSFNFYVHASDGTAMTNTVAVLVMASAVLIVMAFAALFFIMVACMAVVRRA